MYQILANLIILSVFTSTKCDLEDLSLKIIKSYENILIPVASSSAGEPTPVVEETAGANFSLLCDLVSSKTSSYDYDFNISWEKEFKDLRIWREHVSGDSKKVFSIQEPSKMNVAIKRFQPVRAEDSGRYLCVSLKYNLIAVVEVVVRDAKPPVVEERPFIRDTFFCGEHMFQCTNGICIIQHYVCDGKPDCKDGSDESEFTCNGSPCKDKLPCDDGRCIPMGWCCDRHHDPNCNVTNRPKCCQALSDSYDELEYGSTSVTHSHNGARYLFITICTLCILFVILMFLLLASRVVLMARKTDLDRSVANLSNMENIGLHNQATLLSCNVYTCQSESSPSQANRINEDCDVSDPLLFTNEDHPPSYLDVINAQNDNLSEPPPPYTSREVLNVTDERRVESN